MKKWKKEDFLDCSILCKNVQERKKVGDYLKSLGFTEDANWNNRRPDDNLYVLTTSVFGWYSHDGQRKLS